MSVKASIRNLTVKICQFLYHQQFQPLRNAYKTRHSIVLKFLINYFLYYNIGELGDDLILELGV